MSSARTITFDDVLLAPSRTWSTKPNAPVTISRMACAELDGIIYIIGGVSGSTIFNNCRAYNITTGTWTDKTVYPASVSLAAAVALNGGIHVFGGLNANNGNYMKQNRRYDPVTNSWTTLTTFSTIASEASAVEVGGFAYLMGGGNATKVNNMNERYDPLTDTWTALSPIPENRMGHACAVIDNRYILVMGGRQLVGYASTVNTVYCYDTLTDTWTTRAPMPGVRTDFSAGVVDNFVYCMAGATTAVSTISQAVYCYDFNADTWFTMENMLTPCSYYGCVTKDKLIYCIGGVYPSTYNAVRVLSLEWARKSMQIYGDSTMQFDKDVMWNDVLKPGGAPFQTVGRGTLTLIDTPTSGTVKEKNVVINSL